ncbi:MAG TPA: ROK family protein [Bryobacteraceae bacterium]|nr:ROK family protein [Bryobacteraceae bacterium]
MNILAIDIGGTKFSLALFEGGRMTARETRRTDRAGGPEWMLAQIAAITREWRFERCGVGFGGPVDFSNQRVALSTHVEGWRDFPLVPRLADTLRVPVLMDNDANAGALGEARFGAGRGHLPLFYMTLSTGIGGGIVLADGTVYRGADSWAGEIGHLTVLPGGPECLCGSRGCLERMCCGLWLEHDYGLTAEVLLRDPAFVEKYVVDLARGLKAAIMILNPARIVIGGGIAKAGEALFAPLRVEMGRQMTAWSQARVDVVPAELGDDSVLWGALALTEAFPR